MSGVDKKFGFIAVCLASMLIASSSLAGTIGQKRCAVLDKQLSGITHAAKTPPPRSVDELADKARGLCAKGKTAQGLRAFARALTIMGSQPVFPSEQQPNPRIKS
ncbi:MAG: hypothetical protein JWM58_2590 [Rhizobium sp.]|nr:hypothetical protein [Rhizobium sp.]